MAPRKSGAAEAVKASKVNPDDDLSLRPWTDEDDLTGWEVVADSSDTEITFCYSISFTAAESRLLARAERIGDLDVFAVAKQAVLERARELAGEKATAGS